MLELLITAALAQPQSQEVPDPCLAVPAPRPLPSACPRWQSRHRAAEGEWFIDRASLDRRDVGFAINERFIYVQPAQSASFIAEIHYDCTRRRVTLMRLVHYDLRGAVLLRVPLRSSDQMPVTPPPGSPNDVTMTEFCPR